MRVTMQQIADITGVSRGTVDRALHNRTGVNPTVRDQILSVAESLGYIPNPASQLLAANKKEIKIGFILPHPDHSGGFWDDVHEGIRSAEKEFQNYGIHILVKNFSNYVPEEEIRLIDELLAEGISGLAIVPLNNPAVQGRLFRMSESDIPVVLVNTEIENTQALCYVGPDYSFAGRTAAGALALAAGGRHMDLIVFNGTGNMISHTQRITSFLQEITDLNVDCSLVNVYKLFSESGETSQNTSYRLAKRILSEHPNVNAVFTAAGSVRAIAQAIRDCGLEKKITHIAFDLNKSTIEPLQEGGLSLVIGQESTKQGYLPIKILFEYLLKHIRPKQSRIVMQSEIFIRQNAALTSVSGNPE